ncbi:DUF3426 domain-containing protein [Xanthomonas oryzae pv. oryzicola]|uniref:DUF3426 domain-containing protein n=1 Tax=Xanthomonas oryzae TaxID=347 RepID=UPI000A6DB329|nr:DUF3426 domain-containing protein [Xanthomonas oryzae]
MSETPPPHRPLATFLRATPAAPLLIPTPVVPPAEASEQVPPAPVSALPPAPAPEMDAPPAPPVPSPPAAVVPSPQRATGAPGHEGFQTAGSGEPRLPAADTAITANTRIAPAAAPMIDPQRSTPAAAAAMPVDRGAAPTAAATDASAAELSDRHPPPARDIRDSAQQRALRAPATTGRQMADTTDSLPHADRPASHPEPAAATDRAATSTAAGDDAQAGARIAADHVSTPHFQPLPVPALAAPAFARRGIARPRLRASGRQWALVAALVGLLGLQIVIADRAHLATNPRWRPLVSAACSLARCTLPAWREPQALTLLNRDVRPIPGVAGGLQIQASFRNDARWAQAWPWLQLSLSDADGRVIGTRVLSPQEYLGQSPAAHDTLAPGQAVQVAFRVREPAASTAAFSFEFR